MRWWVSLPILLLLSLSCEKNPFGKSATIGRQFRPGLAPAPSIETISPSQGSEDGGTLVRISGNHFSLGMKVFFGTALCTQARVVSESVFECLTPAGTRGEVDVLVQGVGGQQQRLESAFRYVSSIASTPGFAISSGAGVLQSDDYRLEATMGGPPSQNRMRANNYSLEVNLSYPKPEN